jgi:hypothetical protein
MNYQDIYVVDSFEEAEQFKYKHNDQSVEVGTAVGYDKVVTSANGQVTSVDLHCFDGIYFSDEC